MTRKRLWKEHKKPLQTYQPDSHVKHNKPTIQLSIIREFGAPYGQKLVWAYRLRDGRKLFLLGSGRLVNLVCGQGHGADIIDLSFALQAESVRFLVKKRGKLKNRVYRVPRGIDEKAARLKLKSLGLSIDTLTKKQKEYKGHVYSLLDQD